MVGAGQKLQEKYCTAVLIKGGHRSEDCAVDILVAGNEIWRLSAPVVSARSTHGTGCSLSAACAAVMAVQPDVTMLKTVTMAKAYVLAALRNCIQVGNSTWAMGPVQKLPIEDIDYEQIAK